MSVRRSAALTLVAALVLAGCQGEPEPQFEPTPSDSASPSDPETSEEPEAQSAEEFIREWAGLDAQMQNTGDTSAYLSVSNPCPPCRAVAQRVESAYSNGGYLKTDGWHINRIEKVPGKGRYRVDADSSPTTIVEREGADAIRLPGGPILYDLVLKQTQEGWEVVNLLEIAT